MGLGFRICRGAGCLDQRQAVAASTLGSAPAERCGDGALNRTVFYHSSATSRECLLGQSKAVSRCGLPPHCYVDVKIQLFIERFFVPVYVKTVFLFFFNLRD